jgi:hypothetical protein
MHRTAYYGVVQEGMPVREKSNIKVVESRLAGMTE